MGEQMINHKQLFSIVLFMTLVSLHLFSLVQSVNAAKTVTLNPIDYKSVSQANGGSSKEEVMVFSIEYGIKSIAYIAFDLSELPENAIPTSTVLNIKSEAISYTCWISAFCSINADWVETGITWDTKPDLGDYVDAVYVDTMREWYSWESDSLTEAVLRAFKETNKLTIALKTGIRDTYQYGLIIFYPDAKLEITYILDTSAPTFSNIRGQPGSPTPDDEVTVSVTATDDKSGVKEMYLYYSTDGGVNWVKVLMSPVGDSKYDATIPQQSEDTTVQYYIEAFDNALNKAKSETSSYTVKSLPGILLYGLIGVFVLSGIFIIISILIFRFIRKRRKGRGSVESLVNCSARLNKFSIIR